MTTTARGRLGHSIMHLKENGNKPRKYFAVGTGLYRFIGEEYALQAYRSKLSRRGCKSEDYRYRLCGKQWSPFTVCFSEHQSGAFPVQPPRHYFTQPCRPFLVLPDLSSCKSWLSNISAALCQGAANNFWPGAAKTIGI